MSVQLLPGSIVVADKACLPKFGKASERARNVCHVIENLASGHKIEPHCRKGPLLIVNVADGERSFWAAALSSFDRSPTHVDPVETITHLLQFTRMKTFAATYLEEVARMIETAPNQSVGLSKTVAFALPAQRPRISNQIKTIETRGFIAVVGSAWKCPFPPPCPQPLGDPDSIESEKGGANLDDIHLVIPYTGPITHPSIRGGIIH